MEARNGEVRLVSLAGRIAGQPLRASGRWPLGASQGGFRGLFRPADWRRAQAQLDVTQGQLSSLAAAFPGRFAPQGRWDLHLALQNGECSGRIALRDAASGPATPFGIIQAVNADISARGRTLQVENLSGEIGGQTVRIRGRVEVPESGPPRISLTFAMVMLGRTEISEFSPLEYLINNLNSSAYKGDAVPFLTELARNSSARKALYAPLATATKDEKIGLARVLAVSGDKESLPYLEKLSGDTDPEVAQEGLRAVRNLQARL